MMLMDIVNHLLCIGGRDATSTMLQIKNCAKQNNIVHEYKVFLTVREMSLWNVKASDCECNNDRDFEKPAAT